MEDDINKELSPGPSALQRRAIKKIEFGRGFLALPKGLRKKMAQRGIQAVRQVETHRSQSGELVVRGVECGGSSGRLGYYTTFCDEIGAPVTGQIFFEEGIGFNGKHAVVVACALVKVEMMRDGHIYRLSITRHRPDPKRLGSGQPSSRVKRLFLHMEGYLPLDLAGKDKERCGRVEPVFYSKAGDRMEIPPEWKAAVRAAAHGASCQRCNHSHYVVRPSVVSLYL